MKSFLNYSHNCDGPSKCEGANYFIFFTTVFWREKIKNLFIFHLICGIENKKTFIFTPVYWGEKINLNLFFPTAIEKEGKYISSLAHFPIGMGCYLYIK